MNLINKKYTSKLLLIILLFASSFAVAEETVVVGQILNKADKSPVPQVNINFKNTDKVTQSNEEGYFLIRYTGKESQLIFSSVGYKTQHVRVKPGTYPPRAELAHSRTLSETKRELR